jgi:hypothetical protein
MGYSYQELETRIKQLERMLAFTMNSFQTIIPSKIIGGQPQRLTMLDLYYEDAARTGGRDVEMVRAQDQENTYEPARAGDSTSSPSGSVGDSEVNTATSGRTAPDGRCDDEDDGA